MGAVVGPAAGPVAGEAGLSGRAWATLGMVAAIAGTTGTEMDLEPAVPVVDVQAAELEEVRPATAVDRLVVEVETRGRVTIIHHRMAAEAAILVRETITHRQMAAEAAIRGLETITRHRTAAARGRPITGITRAIRMRRDIIPPVNPETNRI